MPVTKELVMDSLRDLPNAKAKIESVALLDGKHVALINDNDFGVAGDTTSIVVAPLYRQVLSGGDSAELKLSRIGRFQNPNAEYDVGAAEIVAYDTASKRAFVINAQAKTVDVLNLSDPANPAKAGVIDVAQALPNAGGINSVSVKNGIVAVAVENSDKQAKGWAAFYAADSLGLYGSVEVGSLPDMITFTPDGSKVLVANEGEPNDDYSNDPEGTVSLIDVATQTVKTVDFSAFNGHEAALRQHGVRIFGKNATAAQDFEPEYIAVSADGQEAYVSLQENNAVAVIDVAQGNLKNLLPLGYKDHSQAGNELDSSDRDSKISFRNAPVWGMYLPDSIAAYKVNGMNYFVTANEGDSRDYTGYSEEERVKNVTLDPAVFPNAAELQADARLGRLKITTSMGDTDNDGDYDKLYAYGARSFSIWNANGEQVFDSGNQLEAITTNALGKNFNSDAEVDDNGNLQPGGDGRSDDKGPEPEALAIGEAYGQTYAFIGLERVGGVMVYNISNPRQPRFVQYFNDIEYGKPALQAGDLAPEGMAFIPAAASPNGKPLLLVGNEVSGTTAIYQLDTME
jgi:DNA-binding beta-propeller fold protein YncE